MRRELAAEQAQRGQTQEQTRRASGPQRPAQQSYHHRNLTELHPSPPHGLSQPLQSQPSVQLYPPPAPGPQTQPPSQLQNQQRNQSQHDDVPLHLSSLQSRTLQKEGHQQSPTDRDTPPISLPQPAASQPQQSRPATKESEQQTTANQQAQERLQSTMHSTSQSADSKMQDYLDLHSVTAQAQLAAAQRNQWMQLAQMARPPIGMNGLSTAFTMDAMQPTPTANSRYAGLNMHGLESGREAVQFPMPQHFDSYSPSPMAHSPFYMSDANEIVPLPVEASEDTAGRFTEINESPDEKGASQLPTQSSPSRQHAEKAALQAGSSGTLRNGATPVATPQVAVAIMGEPFMAHATSIESVKPVASNPALGVDSSVSVSSIPTASRGPSNGQPQNVRVGRPEVSPRPPPIAIPVDVSQKLVDVAPDQDDSARESTIPSTGAVTPENQNSANESSIPMADAQTRIRQRSDSEDEQAAGERPTKRRRTDQVSSFALPTSDTFLIVGRSSAFSPGAFLRDPIRLPPRGLAPYHKQDLRLGTACRKRESRRGNAPLTRRTRRLFHQSRRTMCRASRQPQPNLSDPPSKPLNRYQPVRQRLLQQTYPRLPRKLLKPRACVKHSKRCLTRTRIRRTRFLPNWHWRSRSRTWSL